MRSERNVCSEFEELEKSPLSVNNYYRKDVNSENNEYSSRRWTSDNYTNYQEPRMSRVDGNYLYI